jgi:hypothetical protein
VQLIVYRGWPLAVAEPDRVYVHPALDALAQREQSHPLVRFACALAVHALEIDTGLIDGPFDQARAVRYTRELLMPADEFGPLAGVGGRRPCRAVRRARRAGAGAAPRSRHVIRRPRATALAYASRARARARNQPIHPEEDRCPIQ